MTYQEQYTLFLSTLHQDTRPWITHRDIPKDGSQIYLMCGLDWEDEWFEESYQENCKEWQWIERGDK